MEEITFGYVVPVLHLRFRIRRLVLLLRTYVTRFADYEVLVLCRVRNTAGSPQFVAILSLCFVSRLPPTYQLIYA